MNQKRERCGLVLKLRLVRRLLYAVIIAILLIGTYVGKILVQHNFHVVSPGTIYRSGQMSASALSEVIRRWDIRTVVNLRGASPDHSWYREETNILGNLGVDHADFALSAGREPADEEIKALMEAIRKSPKPILVHCNGGADRSGLISALYLYIIEGRTADDASSQLSPVYGHVPYLHWRYSIAMDRCFWRYVNAHPHSLTNDAASRLNLSLSSDIFCSAGLSRVTGAVPQNH